MEKENMAFSDYTILCYSGIIKLMEKSIESNSGVKLSLFQTRELKNYIKRLQETLQEYDDLWVEIAQIFSNHGVNME